MEEGTLSALGRGRHRGEVLGRYFLWYTLLFLALSPAVFYPFLRAGKSFAWDPDGIVQHYPKLVWLRDAVRSCVRSLLRGEGWTLPLYDFSGGIASQYLQFSPLHLLVVIWPWSAESFYTFHTLAGYYLTGLAFVYFGWSFRQRLLPVLAGAVGYTFCAYALFAGVRHPYFLTPMALLPLLIVGAEKVMRRERGWLLTGAVFLSATSYFGVYFSYMQAVFLVLFVLVRFFDLYETDRPWQFIRLLGRLAVWGGTGALLSCVTALPTMLTILGGDRVGRPLQMLWYGSGYYKKFLTQFSISGDSLGSWMYLGFSALSVPALILLYLRRDRSTRTLRVLFPILTVMHLIPAVAYGMSGFSNVSNRFCFGYAFCVSAVLMFMLPRLEGMERKTAVGLCALTGAYVLLCAVLTLRTGGANTWMAIAALTLSLGAVLVCRRWERLQKLLMPVCLLIVCVSLLCTAFSRYDPRMGNYVRSFAKDPEEELDAGQYAALAGSETVAEDESFFRVAAIGEEEHMDRNAAFLYGLNGLSGYPYYGQSQPYVQWFRELEMARVDEMSLVGFDHMFAWPARFAAPAALAGIKYYAERDGEPADFPYGFTEIDRVTGAESTDVILENENWLPLGYTYDRYMLREDYDALSALDKQTAQLESVVLEKGPAADMERLESVATDAAQIPYEIAEMNGVVWENGILFVMKNGASMTLTFDGLPGTETYLRVVGLDVTSGPVNSLILTAETAKTNASGLWTSDDYVYGNGQKTQLLDLGWSEQGQTAVTLRFSDAGGYHLEDIQLWCQDMSGLASRTAALGAEPLEDIRTNWRGLTGTVSLSKDKMLCIAIPWLDGWRAYVDGQETELYHANTAFMALEVPAGEHTVELRYWMPGLTAGLTLSGAGLVCLAGLILFARRRRERIS